MWKKKKFLTMEEQVAKLSSKCRELTEEESRMLNGGGSNDYGGYNNWSEYAYAMSHEAAGDANKTWMPEKKETSSSNTDSTSSSQKNTGNDTNGNQLSFTHTEGFQMDNMSFTDMNNAYSENIYSYMVNSLGGIMKYNPIKEYDISSNPSELTQITDIPNINNFMDYPDNRTLNNVFSKLYYYFTGK